MNEFYIICFDRNQYSPQEGILFLFNNCYLWQLFIIIIIIIIINIIITIIIIIIIIIITIAIIFCRSAIVDRLIASWYNMANNSQTGPSSYDPLGRSRTEIGFEVALSILICLISILDNLLVVYVVNNDSKLKSVTSTFIHNLALTDISMASFHMPFWIISLYKGTWIFSEKWCEI